MAIFSNTRIQLRHKLSRLMNDLITGVVSSPASGTFVCATTHWEKSDDYFNDFIEVFCYSGTGVGTSGNPTDWANSTHTLLQLLLLGDMQSRPSFFILTQFILETQLALLIQKNRLILNTGVYQKRQLCI